MTDQSWRQDLQERAEEAFSVDLENQCERAQLQQKNCMTISKKGQFCDIIYLEDKHNQRVYAVKNVKTRDEVTGDQWKEVMRRIENEIQMLRVLKHPFIIKFYDYYKNKSSYNLITECYFDDMTVIQQHSEKQVLSEQSAGRYFLQLCLAFDYLHHKGLLFGYITNQDIVLDPFDNVKLVNFSKVQKLEKVSEEMLKRLDVNYEYLAPEYFDSQQRVGVGADVWALGVVLYQWLHNYMPFKQKTQGDHFNTIKNILQTDKQLTIDSQLDSQLAHLLSSLLNKDPLKRITLAAILVHPWILKISDKLDLTDLVNPAFLSNKKLVESLVDCKYPEQLKNCKYGYQYKDASLIGFKTLTSHLTAFDPQQFAHFQDMTPMNIQSYMNKTSQVALNNSRQQSINGVKDGLPKRTIFQDDAPHNSLHIDQSQNNTFLNHNDQQSRSILSNNQSMQQPQMIQQQQSTYIQQPVIDQYDPQYLPVPIEQQSNQQSQSQVHSFKQTFNETPSNYQQINNQPQKNVINYLNMSEMNSQVVNDVQITSNHQQENMMKQSEHMQGIINQYTDNSSVNLKKSKIFESVQERSKKKEQQEMKLLEQRLNFNGA